MKTRLLLVLGILIVSVTQLQAEVLIYFGTLKRFEASSGPVTSLRKLYLAVDQANKKMVFLSFAKEAGVKRRDIGDVQTIDFLPYTRSDGKTEDGFALVENLNPPSTGGSYSSVFFHGPRKNLITSKFNDQDVIAPRARTLKGVSLVAAAFFVGRYQYDTFTVSFVQKPTVQANAANKTIDAVRTDLIGIVEGLGYHL